MDNMCEDRAMTVFAADGRHRVAVLVRDRMLPFELGLVHRLFGQARTDTGTPLYEVLTCALVPGEIRTDTDFAVTVTRGPEALAEAMATLLEDGALRAARSAQGRERARRFTWEESARVQAALYRRLLAG